MIKKQIEEKLKLNNESKDIVILEIDEYAQMHIKNLKMGENSYLFGLLLTETETKLLILK